MVFSGRGAKWNQVQQLEIDFPFNPGLTPTTVLPADCQDDGRMQLPAVVSAPDFGQMLLSCEKHPAIRGRLEGSRPDKIANFTMEIPPAELNETCTLEFRPVYLSPPAGLRDLSLWPSVRRGWFNVFQTTAQWGEKDKPFSSPPGLLGNNVLSDPASLALWPYADQALWTPESPRAFR